jgi:hypothetical protein
LTGPISYERFRSSNGESGVTRMKVIRVSIESNGRRVRI